jgi:hypothetical protein
LTIAQTQFGASVFWLRRLGCLEGEQAAVEYWQNPLTYRLSASGFLAEVDRMQLEVRDYLALHPSELVNST